MKFKFGGADDPMSSTVLISCAYVSASGDNRLTDRNTVTTICRSSVFQSISEPATSLSLSLSSVELLDDECKGIFMYVCMQWLVLSLCVRRFSFHIGA